MTTITISIPQRLSKALNDQAEFPLFEFERVSGDIRTSIASDTDGESFFSVEAVEYFIKNDTCNVLASAKFTIDGEFVSAYKEHAQSIRENISVDDVIDIIEKLFSKSFVKTLDSAI